MTTYNESISYNTNISYNGSDVPPTPVHVYGLGGGRSYQYALPKKLENLDDEAIALLLTLLDND